MSDTPAAGHNLPDLTSIVAPDVMAVLIGTEIEPLKARADELIASCKRFVAAHPTIGNEDSDRLAAQVLATTQRFTAEKTGRVEKARMAFLRPLRAAVTTVGSYERGPFATVIESVENAVSPIVKASLAWKVSEETRKRKLAQAEADRLAAEAAKLEAAAQQGHATYDEAAAAYVEAESAQSEAAARPAELTRTHGDALGTTSLRYKRTVTIVEPAKVDRQYCVPDLGLLTRAAGKAGTPLPIISGCNVADVPDLTVRR